MSANNTQPQTRIEKDSMGSLEVPIDALYGAQTQRAINNFPISGIPMPKAFIHALCYVKFACSSSNQELGLLSEEKADAIQEEQVDIDLKDEVNKLSPEDVQDLIHVVQRDLRKAYDIEMKIKQFGEILPIMQKANLPNLEVLDKLMRYQTSLNNQLSKQMGELIELEKRYGQKD